MLTTFEKALLATIAGAVLVIALVLAARGPAVAAAGSQVVTGGSSGGIAPGIVTLGDATVKIKPDLAILTVGAVAQADTAAQAQTVVAQRVDRILAAAKTLGIADKDVATSAYRIEPQYAYDQGKAPRITGYQATQMLTLKVRTIDAAGRALDALVQNDGATNASLAFSLEDPKPTEAQARELAIKDAQAKADAMAKTAGVSLGKIVSISETTSTPIPYKAIAAPLPAGAGGGTQVPVGELEVQIRVQVQFAIQ